MMTEHSSTDCKVHVALYANGVLCEEYPLSDSSLIFGSSCCVAVEKGQEISLKGFLEGAQPGSHIDLIVDGVFRNHKPSPEMQKSNSAPQAEANKRVATTCTKTIEFSLAYFDTQRTLSSRQMVVANLDISHPGEVKADRWEDGVGCISVIISIQLPPQADGTDIKYAHKYRTVRAISTPRNIIVEKSLTSMPPPTFYTSLEQGVGEDFESYMGDEKKALFTAQSGIGDLLTSNVYRPGTRPWARLNFFYRTQSAIDAANLQPAKGNSYTLQMILNVEEEEQQSQGPVNKIKYGSKLHPIELDVGPSTIGPDMQSTVGNLFPGNDTNMQDRDCVDPALRELEFLDDEQSANPIYEQDAHMQGTSPPEIPDDSAYNDDLAQQ